MTCILPLSLNETLRSNRYRDTFRQRPRPIVGNPLDHNCQGAGRNWHFNRSSISESGWHFVFDVATIGKLLRSCALHKSDAGLHVEINRNGDGAVVLLASGPGIAVTDEVHSLEFLAQDREDAKPKTVQAAVNEPVGPINHQILPLCPLRASPVRLSEPHFDDQPRCNDAECSERSYDYAKDKLTGFAPSRLHRCVLKTRILLRKPVLSLDTLFSRQVSHVADPKFVPDLGSTEPLKASAILVRYCHLSRFAPRASPVRFASGLRDIEMNYSWIACANRIRKFTISSTSFRCSAVCVRS